MKFRLLVFLSCAIVNVQLVPQEYNSVDRNIGQSNYAQQTFPKSGQYVQQSNIPQTNYPQSSFPQSSFPQSNFPQGSNYPQSNYPQSNYPSNNFPQSGYPNDNYPQGNYGDDGFSQDSFDGESDRVNNYGGGGNSYGGKDGLQRYTCPQHWIPFRESCYRFMKSPARPRNEARKICQAYESDLVSIDTVDEHGFLIYQLMWQDPQHRRWYTSARQQSPQYWTNDGDGVQLTNMDNAFLPHQYDSLGKDYLAYKFSSDLKRWGFEMVSGEELLLFVCEAHVSKLLFLIGDDRTYTYGINVDDPDKVPRGPYFIKEPVDKTFDLSKNSISNDVSLSCLAGGYPTPTYEWFREDYQNDVLVATKIDPLSDERFTVSGGTLIIYDPDKIADRTHYHCKATNRFGSIVSESVLLSFGFIREFNLKRSSEAGNQNWGKVLYCDPPPHYPGVKYYWVREYFPNFVEEDQRVFVSFDGGLYFSALETIDRGNYSCNVQSKVSDTGRNGPLFPLMVNPHSNYQQLKFPNNFPKVFPEAPVVGQEVRMECMAFGYPVPSYNWTRKGADIPRHSYQLSFSRILVIPQVSVEDEGEYVCTINNDRASMNNSVILSVQAEPNFTIPLSDRHVDNKGDLTWTCEAFGIPDVNYTWWRNGQELSMENLANEDKDRYHIQDNVLSIRYLNPERDPGMYQCRARNQLKATFSSGQLRVLSLKPSFKKRPLESETYGAEGGNVTILCNPEAAPRPKFIWKKDNNVIGGGGRRRILDNGNLIISPVSRDDEGVYTCSASNQYGADESKGRLIVLQAPRFIERLPPRIQTQVYQNLFLHCNAHSDELLDTAFIWTHNGIRIMDTNFVDFNFFDDKRIKIDGGLLDIFNVSLSDAGEYECIVKSAVGRISSRTMLVVEGPPGPPGGLQVVSIKKNSATIHWTDGASNGKPILGYIVTGRTNWNSTWTNVSGSIYAREIDRYNGRKEGVIENALAPWSVYEFKIQAFNQLGFGLTSAPSPQHSTPSDKPYRPPHKISGGGGKIGDLTITWEPITSSEQNGPNIHYKIFWRRTEHDTEFQSLLLKEFGNVGMSVVHVSPEYFYTKYDVKVQAINDVGPGPVSEPVTIFSAEDMPQVAPQQIAAVSFNSTALNVTWMPIDQTRERIRGKLIGHRLKYWKKDNKEEECVYYLSRSTRNWALVVGLQPDTYYFVKVMAFNSAGEGPESERYLERTYRKAPQKPPSSVHVYGVNPSTVRVVWRYVAPSLEEEPIQGYKVRSFLLIIFTKFIYIKSTPH